jgi:hypothetical protein
MSDYHSHYDYADKNHGHYDYSPQGHDHDLDYAQRYHRHHDEESKVRGLREDLSRAEERIRELEGKLDSGIRRLWDHIGNMQGGI